jgi:hypothetical protein
MAEATRKFLDEQIRLLRAPYSVEDLARAGVSTGAAFEQCACS